MAKENILIPLELLLSIDIDLVSTDIDINQEHVSKTRYDLLLHERDILSAMRDLAPYRITKLEYQKLMAQKNALRFYQEYLASISRRREAQKRRKHLKNLTEQFTTKEEATMEKIRANMTFKTKKGAFDPENVDPMIGGYGFYANGALVQFDFENMEANFTEEGDYLVYKAEQNSLDSDIYGEFWDAAGLEKDTSSGHAYDRAMFQHLKKAKSIDEIYVQLWNSETESDYLEDIIIEKFTVDNLTTGEQIDMLAIPLSPDALLDNVFIGRS